MLDIMLRATRIKVTGMSTSHKVNTACTGHATSPYIGVHIVLSGH